MKPKMYSFDEIGLIPSITTKIESRKDIVFDEKLPIFISPMTCILSDKNFEEYKQSRFIPIYPIKFGDTSRYKRLIDGDWISVTLNEFEDWFCNSDELKTDNVYKVLIDCANGHMERIYRCVKKAKKKYKKLIVMIGNIANPETYKKCCDAKIDYVRVSAGTGSHCSTSVVTAFHASLPWLLTEINKIKKRRLFFKTKVIADGGIDSISKIIKSFALGADYVMLGKMIAECGETGTYKLYYGQASVQGQIDRFGQQKSYPEGVQSRVFVKYSLNNFTQQIISSLRSALSYGNAKTLKEFIGKVKYKIQSLNEFKCYDK